MTATEFDDCDTAPLHRIAEIQSCGAIVCINTNNICISASKNVGDYIGIAAPRLVGKLVDKQSCADPLLSLASTARELSDGEYEFRTITFGETVSEVLLHQVESVAFIELFSALPTIKASQPESKGILDFAHELQRCDSVEACGELLLDVVARIVGFDRIMLYRFNHDWDGEVLAEHLGDRVEGFLGQRFPAEDIPPNARMLYTKNPVRTIPNIDDEPVAILEAEGRPSTDMTYSRLRAVHPVHLTYLRNMNVRASFSLSIVCNDQLWGMIACHSFSPKPVPLALQLETESYLSIAIIRMSWLLERIKLDYRQQFDSSFNKLRHHVTSFDQRHLLGGIFAMADQLCLTFEADGCWIQLGDSGSHYGSNPSEEAVIGLLAWIKNPTEPVCTSYSELPVALRRYASLKRLASGALFIPLLMDSFILLFRKEQIENVNWAGRVAIDGNDGLRSLSPRKSFELWVEKVEFRSTPWPEELLSGARIIQSEISDLLTTAHFAGLAFTDALTGLANRTRLREFMQSALESAEDEHSTLAVYFLDLDGFKEINDRYGHGNGDELLRIVARRLESLLRDQDLLARLGGDEFIIVQKGIERQNAIDAVVKRIERTLGQTISIANEQLQVGVSVGVSIYPDDGDNIDELMGRADSAMYRAKVKRKNAAGH